MLFRSLRGGTRYGPGRDGVAQRLANLVLAQMERRGATPDDRELNAVARSKPVRQLLDVVWPRVMERVGELADSTIEMLIDEADGTLAAAADRAGFIASEHSDVTAWMDAGSRPAVTPPPPGFRLVSRDQVGDRPHHMIARNGDAVGQRLVECSLYRADLDLAVYDGDGAVAAYGLFWADLHTGVGLVEPMRTEGPFQQRGLARAVLTAGLDRLAAAGCDRFKVSYEPVNAASRRLYLTTGFNGTSTSRAWIRGRQH